MKLLFTHARILTMEDGNKILEDAMLAVEGNRIAYVGATDEAWLNRSWDRVLDMSGRLLMPGLINAHTHLSMSVLRGCGSDMPLWPWLSQAIFPREDRFTQEDYTVGAMMSVAEMIRGGTTCCMDMYMGMEHVARVLADAGFRGVLARSLSASDQATLDWKLKEATDLYDHWHHGAEDRIRVWFSPHAEYTMVPETLRGVAEAARVRKTGMALHLSETAGEVQGCMERYGVSPAQLMEQTGTFDVPCVAAHCVHLSGQDAEILKNHGVSVVHNPCSNMKLGSGFAPVADYLEKGLTVALGTDSSSSNNRLDMFREMYMAGVIHKGQTGDTTKLAAGQVLRMATLDGARALHMENEIGSLKVGKKADLIAVNLSAPAYHPLAHLLGHLVYSASASDVELTMVDGRILMENFQLKTLDLQEITRRMELCAQRIQ